MKARANNQMCANKNKCIINRKRNNVTIMCRNLNAFDVESLSDHELKNFLEVVKMELYTRNLNNCDPSTLLKLGFDQGFTSKLTTVTPWIVGGVLIAPGYKKEASAFSHKCSFVKVNDSWVWESEYKVDSEIRNSNKLLQSVTLIALFEGAQVDVLTSKARNSVHILENITSYMYENDDLIKTSSRNVSTKGQL